jgi:hypothetical protein
VHSSPLLTFSAFFHSFDSPGMQSLFTSRLAVLYYTAGVFLHTVKKG